LKVDLKGEESLDLKIKVC